MADTDDSGIIGDSPHEPMTLEELRASMIPMTVLERVRRAALGEEPMDKNQIAAAKLFLGKTQPDLKAVELTGKDGKPILVTIAATEDDARL